MLFCFKTCAFVFSVFMQLVLTLQLLTSDQYMGTLCGARDW